MKPATKKEKVSRQYTARTLKILWGRSAGRCAIPTCRIDVLVEATEHDPVVVVGDIAHIEGAAQGAARHNARLTREERDDYENLILLCKVCHARLDGQRFSNTTEKIRALRTAHEAWVRENLPERGRSRVGWRVAILQGGHRIDVPSALAALSPDFEDGDPVVLTVAAEDDWSRKIEVLVAGARKLLSATDTFSNRVAIFPLAPVSACIALGYALTNRPHTRAHQFQRDQGTWAWMATTNDATAPTVTAWPHDSASASEIAICFDLSGRVAETSVRGERRNFGAVVRIGVASPSTSWLQTAHQLTALGTIARETFERVAASYPDATTWHIFYAGPAPGAVVVGQQLNPSTTPRVQLYEFQKGADEEHRPSITLEAGFIRPTADPTGPS